MRAASHEARRQEREVLLRRIRWVRGVMVVALVGAVGLGVDGIRHHHIMDAQWLFGIVSAMFMVVVSIAGLIGFLRLEHSLKALRRLDRIAGESDQRLAGLTEVLQESLFTIDARTGALEWLNPATERIFGYPPETLLGVSVTQLMPDSFEPGVEGLLRAQAEVGALALRPEGVASLGRKADGTIFPVHFSMSPLRLGGRLLYAGSLRDISRERADAEAMDGALKAAEAATVVKGQFLANISHELRTPLNAVIGMTGLLLDTALTAEQHLLADTARSSGEVLLEVLNNVLDFSKLEAGKLALHELPFDLVDICDETLELVAHQAQVRDIELGLLMGDVPSRVVGDPGRFRQVLLNLLANALKFTEAGQVSVALSVVHPQDAALRVRVEVRDTGVGIGAIDTEQLFEPFVQGDGSASRRHGGTGLGLAISRHLVEVMGGKIGVESTLGVGSTFWLEVPLGRPTEPAPLRSTVFKGTRVLVVASRSLARTVLSERLKSLHVQMVAVASFEEARPWIQADPPPSMAFIDLGLDEEGLSWGALAHDLDPDLPLVLVSPIVAGDARRRARRVGFVGHLPKPIRGEVLRTCLSVALGGGHPGLNTVELAPISVERALKVRVLVVEDNVVNQMVVVRMLNKLGCMSEVVNNGLEALDAVASGDFDLLLMDCQMPVLDGYEATRRLRRSGSWLPILAMTANAMPGDRARCLEAGMDDYLPKPLRAKALQAALERWVGGAHESVDQRPSTAGNTPAPR